MKGRDPPKSSRVDFIDHAAERKHLVASDLLGFRMPARPGNEKRKVYPFIYPVPVRISELQNLREEASYGRPLRVYPILQKTSLSLSLSILHRRI